MNHHDKEGAEVLKRLIAEEEARLVIEDRKVIKRALEAARDLMDEDDDSVRVEGMKLWLQTRIYTKLDRLERYGTKWFSETS